MTMGEKALPLGRMMDLRRLGAKAFVLALGLSFGQALWSARACAESPSDRIATAQALFDQARQLMAKGQYREACPKLEESQRLDPGGGTLLNLADCYEHQGHVASAWAKFLEAAGAAHAAGNVDRERTARERAAALATKLPKLAINVAPSPAAGLEIRRDGEALGQTQWGVPLPVDPGEHAITASAPGRTTWRRTVMVGTAATTVTISVPDLESGATIVDARQDAPASTFGTQRILALAASSIGVVGVAVGSVFGLQSISKRREADKACDATTCNDQASVDLTDEAIRAGNVSTIAFAVGAVGLASGAVLWFTATPKAPVAGVGIGMGTLQLHGVW